MEGTLISGHLQEESQTETPEELNSLHLVAAENARESIESANGQPVADLIEVLRFHVSFLMPREPEMVDDHRQRYEKLVGFRDKSDIDFFLHLCGEAIWEFEHYNQGRGGDCVKKIRENFLKLCTLKDMMDEEQRKYYDRIKHYLAIHGPLPHNA